MTVIRTQLPKTHYEQPSRRDVEMLLEFVQRRHPELAEVTVTELNLSLWSVGHQFRLDQPTSKVSPSFFLDRANSMLGELGWPTISGPAFFAGCLAHGDVAWRQADHGGEVFELALDCYAGRPCSTPNQWRAVASGHASLLPPVPPRGDRVRTALGNRSRIYEKATGREIRATWANT